jgi:formylglycine-generating enzyme required for sulfatase activity
MATSQTTESAGASNRVSRGGGWFDEAGNCRAAVRGWLGPSVRFAHLGFRPARRVKKAL